MSIESGQGTPNNTGQTDPQGQQTSPEQQETSGQQNTGSQIQIPENLPEGVTPEAYRKLHQQWQESTKKAPQPEPPVAVKNARRILESMRSGDQTSGSSAAAPPLNERVGVFANPMVAHLNKMYTEGKSMSDIQSFLDLQRLDPASMSPTQALTRKMMMEIGLSESDALQYIETKYGADLPADTNDPRYEFEKKAMESRIKVDGLDARRWLQNQQLSFDTPEAQQARKEAEKTRNANLHGWTQVASALTKPDDVVLKFAHEDKSIGGKYTFDYKPKLDEATVKRLNTSIVQFAMSNNLPLDDENSINTLMTLRDNMLKTMFHEDMIQHALSDFYSGLMKSLVNNQPQLFNRGGQRFNAPAGTKKTSNKVGPKVKEGFM
jgi:hypothetical protein